MLALADLEHLCAALRAHALCRRPTILHGDLLGVLHLPLGAALHAISIHCGTLLLQRLHEG